MGQVLSFKRSRERQQRPLWTRLGTNDTFLQVNPGPPGYQPLSSQMDSYRCSWDAAQLVGAVGGNWRKIHGAALTNKEQRSALEALFPLLTSFSPLRQ